MHQPNTGNKIYSDIYQREDFEKENKLHRMRKQLRDSSGNFTNADIYKRLNQIKKMFSLMQQNNSVGR